MNEKQQHLLRILSGYCRRDVIVAFSGGVDSSLLVKVANEAAQKHQHSVHAVTFQTALHPIRELALTQRLAAEIGVVHHVVEVDELAEAGIRENPQDRCYRCKKFLFGRLRTMADSMGIEVVMDGTNLDDLGLYRPGLLALRELDIVSPLAEAGLSKIDIRELAESYCLSVANRPSTPCLATRFPYGTVLSVEKMASVAEGEAFLQSLGFHDVRLRVHGDIARIEIDREKLSEIIRLRESLVGRFKQLGFAYVTVDLEGFRSGSMDSSP